jgi:hypothetical protein
MPLSCRRSGAAGRSQRRTLRFATSKFLHHGTCQLINRRIGHFRHQKSQSLNIFQRRFLSVHAAGKHRQCKRNYSGFVNYFPMHGIGLFIGFNHHRHGFRFRGPQSAQRWPRLARQRRGMTCAWIMRVSTPPQFYTLDNGSCDPLERDGP